MSKYRILEVVDTFQTYCKPINLQQHKTTAFCSFQTLHYASHKHLNGICFPLRILLQEQTKQIKHEMGHPTPNYQTKPKGWIRSHLEQPLPPNPILLPRMSYRTVRDTCCLFPIMVNSEFPAKAKQRRDASFPQTTLFPFKRTSAPSPKCSTISGSNTSFLPLKL